MSKVFKFTSTTIAYVVIILMAIITIFPFIYMILASLMSYQETMTLPPTLIPEKFLFSNYVIAFSKAPFLRYFFNTTFVALASTAGVLVTGILSAFALVNLNFKGKKFVVLILISLLMVPYEATVFTNYQTIAQLKWINTYQALIVPSLASIFYTYYLQNYIVSIPLSYYKAAKIDGCTNLEYIRRILLPLAKPALVTVGILSFISSWNSFLWPLLVTNSKEMRLLNNGLSAFATEAGSEIQLQMAAATITIIPVLILYFIFRKQIINGVAKNGIKG